MKISHKWLQTYFAKPLPLLDMVAEAFGIHLSEIEGMEEKNGDTVYDIKILPDRSCYALSHRGIAYELSAILKLAKSDPTLLEFKTSGTVKLEIKIESELCRRYIGRRIESISIGDSPDWLKEKLDVLGQRSINSVVDLANYVMLDMGEPLHAFDADKVKGAIIIRNAKDGEKITTLDSKEVILDSNMLVIADEESVLAIAGIKGGKKAEVTRDTKNLILEAANFDPVSIRKTSTKIGIKNDSSKRFENGLSPVLAEKGMEKITSLIASIHRDAKVGEIVDTYIKKQSPVSINVTSDFISKVLGLEISNEEIVDILNRLEIKVEEDGDNLKLYIPGERMDLNIPEDIVEEVGRIYGYDKIPVTPLTASVNSPKLNKNFYWAEKVKDILVDYGFSEVSTYALASKGEFEIEKSIATDKNFLRTNLSENIQKSIQANLHNAPLLGLQKIAIFEIGKVFSKDGEHTSLCVGIGHTKGYKGESVNEEIRQTREYLLEHLSASVMTVCTIDDTGGILMIKSQNNGGKPVQIGKINEIDGIMELNFGALTEILPEPAVYDMLEIPKNNISYKNISSYPFMLRDIAVFVPGETGNEQKVLDIVQKDGTELLVRTELFDSFTKKPSTSSGQEKVVEGVKTSYAYHLVFQSNERTLTDAEINVIMEQITAKMNAQNGWQVR